MNFQGCTATFTVAYEDGTEEKMIDLTKALKPVKSIEWQRKWNNMPVEKEFEILYRAGLIVSSRNEIYSHISEDPSY